jgi:hypothetical protein
MSVMRSIQPELPRRGQPNFRLGPPAGHPAYDKAIDLAGDTAETAYLARRRD